MTCLDAGCLSLSGGDGAGGSLTLKINPSQRVRINALRLPFVMLYVAMCKRRLAWLTRIPETVPSYPPFPAPSHLPATRHTWAPPSSTISPPACWHRRARLSAGRRRDHAIDDSYSQMKLYSSFLSRAALTRWTLTIHPLSGTHLFPLLLRVLTSHLLPERLLSATKGWMLLQCCLLKNTIPPPPPPLTPQRMKKPLFPASCLVLVLFTQGQMVVFYFVRAAMTLFW